VLILSSNDIMELLDVRSGGTLTKWKTLGAGQAAIGRNKWDGRKFLEWWLTNIFDGACAETDGSLAEVRRDYWGAKAEGERLKVDREKGEFVLKAGATAEKIRLISTTVSALKNLPARLSGQLVGKVDRVEIDNIINLETAALCAIMASGATYSDASVSAAIDKMGGMSPRQALAEKVQAQATMPLYMKYDPRKKVFTDERDGTVVPLAEADAYVRAYPYLRLKNKNGEKQNDEK
jgi:hypothetical protein